MNIHEDKVLAVIDKKIKGGRIIGLTKWEGKTVKVLIMEDVVEKEGK
ncbi:unnamed protein product [marine sediment metagenome]|uniref:Uncharacterized protein n=1 Tax=marine sediment metagenome TaxID=412755 RepID=X0YMB4_9ZZZZ